MRGKAAFGLAAIALFAGGALAGPATKGGPSARGLVMGPHNPIDGTFSDNFDGYATGSQIVGQGGWQFWGTAALNGTLDSATSASAPNSLRGVVETDVIQLFNLTSGKYRLRVKTFTPSGMVGQGWVIALNTHDGPPITAANWSLQIRFNPALGQVISDFGGQIAPLITDQWVELRADIDLDATGCLNHGNPPPGPGQGCLDVYYNGTQFVFDENWSQNVSGAAGVAQFRCIDLYSTGDGFRWDDLVLEDLNCYPDCNGSGTLTIADFGCFQAAFAGNLPYADCNNSGTLTIADFACFQSAFSTGCP